MMTRSTVPEPEQTYGDTEEFEVERLEGEGDL